MTAGVAGASQAIVLVRPGAKDKKLPMSEKGLKEVLAQSAPGETIVLAGNSNWLTAFAHGLQSHGRAVRFLPSPMKERGQRQSHAAMLGAALEHGIVGRPFFRDGKSSAEAEVPHPWVEMANQYFLLLDGIRQAKHRVLNALRILYPELVAIGDKLWGQRVSRRWEDSTGPILRARRRKLTLLL